MSCEAQEEAARLRASYKQQIITLEGQVAELERALHDARSTAPLSCEVLSPYKARTRKSTSQSAHGTAAVQGAGQALVQRIKQLEAANVALERALLDTHGKGGVPAESIEGAGSTAESAQLQHAHASLAAREAEVQSLQMQVQDLRSALTTVCAGNCLSWLQHCFS